MVRRMRHAGRGFGSQRLRILVIPISSKITAITAMVQPQRNFLLGDQAAKNHQIVNGCVVVVGIMRGIGQIAAMQVQQGRSANALRGLLQQGPGAR